MADDLSTEEIIEGFPDTNSGWRSVIGGKLKDPNGNKYTEGDKPGYILQGHDRTADGKSANTINYINTPQTEYYYICRGDGIVRQFDSSNLFSAKEYLDFEESITETVASVDIVMYQITTK